MFRRNVFRIELVFLARANSYDVFVSRYCNAHKNLIGGGREKVTLADNPYNHSTRGPFHIASRPEPPRCSRGIHNKKRNVSIVGWNASKEFIGKYHHFRAK